ncbi:hypothetical protein T440DRAFT_464743 [Plenodomus tracheiphilus IPT5]|uniref:Uncharacterized protein n=1 Tax=Plenodomus tracheiphilus IPT5 TaxID=1408161 RepID=A0A6A7BGR0_9PLEO|nr:hypothetical protein T440DRAFT_464743 [Plenodomus tracheiphilus IPT5]
MYRRSDPRWNRTLQHISDNLEHANESAQENLYGFTQRYVSPCFASAAQCLQTCTAPCFPAHNDHRRRHRGRAQGRAESSFDFYDDWDADEGDGLLGWGSDHLDRFLGGASTYGTTTTQPARQPAMGYGPRSRDPRYSTPRRKSTALPREAGQDPTIIPSSSYFGFLGRLPWRIGGNGLRYKPSAADLADHPGAIRSMRGGDQPLMDASDDEELGTADQGGEAKFHRRQRSDTRTSGHTTDSLSSRGDIFPSEDELEDAVPLDDEFTIALERRTTGQWNEDSSSKSKRPSGSRLSTRTASSPNTNDSRRQSAQGKSSQHTTPHAMDGTPTLGLRKPEEAYVENVDDQRGRYGDQQLACRRGLAPEHSLRTPSSKSSTPRTSSPQPTFQMTTVQSTVSPLLRSPASELTSPADHIPFPSLVDAQTMPDSSSLHVDEPDYSSMVPTPMRPSSVNEAVQDNEAATVVATAVATAADEDDYDFVPARLPHFGAGPE